MPRQWLVPDWPVPRNVRAFVTTRAGGVSAGEYASMNLGASSGDEPSRVERNRQVVLDDRTATEGLRAAYRLILDTW